MQTGEKVKEFQAHSRKINTIINVGDKVWTASDDSQICIWDQRVRNYTYIRHVYHLSLHFLKRDLKDTSDPLNFETILQSFELVHTIKGGHHSYVYGLCDLGSTIWSSGWDKRICLWDPKVSSPPKKKHCKDAEDGREIK